jgi:hypothetical protein
MKYFFVILPALILGYVIYPMINPAPEEKIIYRTEKITNVTPIETRGHVIQDVPAPSLKEQESEREINVKVDVTEEKVFPLVPEKAHKKVPEKLTIAERIMANKIDIKTYVGFSSFPNIPVQDSRIVKLNGSFKGKYKSKTDSRTGLLENVAFEVNVDPEKEMTKFEIVDVYDNRGFNVYQLTENTFKSVPGDENFLLMRIPQGFIIFDIKRFPEVSGRKFLMNKLVGTFTLKRKD